MYYNNNYSIVFLKTTFECVTATQVSRILQMAPICRMHGNRYLVIPKHACFTNCLQL